MTREISTIAGRNLAIRLCIVFAFIPLTPALVHAVIRIQATRHDPLAAFVAYFDEDVSNTAPQLMKIAHRDPAFHEAFLERSKRAYLKGGWIEVNAALYPFLESHVALYADNPQVLRLANAHRDLLTTLQHSHGMQACKTLGLAARTGPTLRYDADFMRSLVRELEAIIAEGGDIKPNVAPWVRPSSQEMLTMWQALRDG